MRDCLRCWRDREQSLGDHCRHSPEWGARSGSPRSGANLRSVVVNPSVPEILAAPPHNSHVLGPRTPTHRAHCAHWGDSAGCPPLPGGSDHSALAGNEWPQGLGVTFLKCSGAEMLREGADLHPNKESCTHSFECLLCARQHGRLWEYLGLRLYLSPV